MRVFPADVDAVDADWDWDWGLAVALVEVLFLLGELRVGDVPFRFAMLLRVFGKAAGVARQKIDGCEITRQ